MDYFERLTTQVEIHGKAMDGRDREALIFPDRVKNNLKLWGYQSIHGDLFNKDARRESDKFDPDL